MNPLLKDILSIILIPALTGLCVLAVMHDRQKRDETDSKELRNDMKEFADEFKHYINNLNLTMREHTIMQTVTTNTLSGLVSKMESLERRVNLHETTLAVISERNKEQHG